jgi:hypothetical protein
MAKLLSVNTVVESRLPVTVEARKFDFLQDGTVIVSTMSPTHRDNSWKNVKIVQVFRAFTTASFFSFCRISRGGCGIRLVCWVQGRVAKTWFDDGVQPDCSEGSGDMASYEGECFFILIFKQLE